MSSYCRSVLINLQKASTKLKANCQQVNLTNLVIFEALLIAICLCFFFTTVYNFPEIQPIWRKRTQNDKLMDMIRDYNTKQNIYNEEIYGPVDWDTVVIVIVVHDRLNYLKYLLDSLYRARDIERALLIFSHDHYSEKVNNFIRKTNFAKYMQIFYPYSIQTHLNRFPGYETKECFKLHKVNTNHTDICHRKADMLQPKHHYWWTINTVFEGLEISKKIRNLILFLEEDQIVLRDFIYTLFKMNFKRKTLCPHCNVLSLGTYNSTFKFPDTYTVSISPFAAHKHNMGMAFNKTTWHRIRNCAKDFCIYNDYNWDQSLQYISLTCARLKVMMMKASRVYHIGLCDTNRNSINCSAADMVNKIQRDVKKKRHYLFPLYYQAENEDPSNESIQPSGSWNDDRDHRMCMSLTSRAITFKSP